MTKEQIQEDVRKLGKWFHNIDLNGVKTAPDHFLGDYPNFKYRNFAHAIPENLEGKTVLDVGCNAGFYSIEMKKRGAERVLGIDSDEKYLAQARYAASTLGFDIEFRNMSVYEVGSLGEKFDVVIFMGVLYHLRHPLLALDLLYENVVKDMLIFQSMQRGSNEVEPVKPDYNFQETGIFSNPNFPQMYFIEHRYSQDPTNWWIPNRAGAEAMLRSAGFEITMHPEPEVYICRRGELSDNQARAVYPVKKN
ncbi:TIGR04290 family methyltransferase [Dyadobacter sediminis]|uniref:TIGR04290 family methyltransferase n=1 Tax=Dyadobacter sediminis TaxID=1493691 RepID=A0A5R9KIV5_9BACT|nr:TIGR04290 family methyltransferase [Dyadobacter sediminis]TLU96114.1 TIGR04290 family methyltransferase [Dyadobacter sediminis]GGB79386.1 methyltransferase, TIGR04290 family protein [Dyadobacter sediminis]